MIRTFTDTWTTELAAPLCAVRAMASAGIQQPSVCPVYANDVDKGKSRDRARFGRTRL